jgi:lipopolysaccharide/colanic/teichoic acid biosynthesis glycosyltransferase
MMLRRLMDATLAGAALLATSPLLAVLAAAIKLESRGPAIFIQIRVGRRREPIRVMKLRTMVVDAERSGLSITVAHDPRVTRVGRFLRKTKLDELPQLWNVLRGDMAFVGPRPEVPRYVAQYRPEWEGVFDVRPGLTDLASLTFRDEERLLALAEDRDRAYREVVLPMKLELALETVRRRSVVHDLVILARTASSIIRPPDPTNDPILREASRRIERLNAESHR